MSRQATPAPPGQRLVDDDLCRLEVFTVLWSSAILFQLIATTWIQQNITLGRFPGIVGAELVLLFSAVAGILFPKHRLPLTILALSQVVDTLLSLPEIPNHRLVTFGINTLLLFTLLQSRGGSPTFRRAAFDRFISAARASVIVVYFYAVLHKLNGGFFYPPQSCATVFYLHIQEIIPQIPTEHLLLTVLPIATVVAESVLAAGLLSRRWRTHVAVFGMVFHFTLAFDLFKHFFDFSSTMTALLSLFLPTAMHRDVCNQLACRPFLTRGWRALLLVFYTTILVAGFSQGKAESYYYYTRVLLWLLYAVPTLFLFTAALRHRKAADEPAVPPLSFARAIVPLAFLINGTGPYVGFKDRSSFDMYSNLRVEHRSTNHFFLPSLDVFNFLKDPVTIRSTDQALLQSGIVDSHLQMIRFELARYFDEHPDAQIRISFNDQDVLLTPAVRAELAPQLPWWLTKLIWFRPFDPEPIERCKW